MHGDYTVAWICALLLELVVVKIILDDVYSLLSQPESDHNVYILGRVGSYNIIIIYLPSGVYGMISIIKIISYIVSIFPILWFRFELMVGIRNRVPSLRNNIYLSNIIVSRLTTNSSGVIQFDYNKTLRGGWFQYTGLFNKFLLVLLKPCLN